MSDILAKMRNLITLAAITLASKDDGDFQIGQTDANGKPLDTQFVYPYGMAANAPRTSQVLRMLIDGSIQNTAGIPINPGNRFKNLKEWEVAVGNFLKKSKIFFDEDGNVEIDASEFDKDVTIKVGSGKTVIEGNLEVKGNITATGDIDTSTGDVTAGTISLKTHLHSGVTSGPANTGGPVPVPPGP